MYRLPAITMLILASLLLSACGSTGFMADTSGHVDAAAVPAPAPVDPYLTNRRSVSREANLRFERANRAMATQDWPAAIVELEWLVETQADLSGPPLNLALVYQQLGELENAEHFYRQALRNNHNNLVAYNQYAIFLREQGRFEEAAQTYRQALDIWEPHAQTHRNIGVLYDLYMGDQALALQHFYRYQALSHTQDKVVAGWIADLNRQLMTLAQGE